MTWAAAAAIMGGSQIASGLLGARASKKAAAAQAAAQREAMAAQERMYNKAVALQEPFRQAGLTAQNRLLFLLGEQGGGDGTGNLPTGYSQADFGSMARPFGEDQFQADPGYAFRMSEGLKALDRSAAARGGLLSGATLRGAQRYGQDVASQEYQNAFNRYQVERQARLNPLQSLMGAGQSSANVLTNAAGGYGQQLGEGLTSLGNIRAANYMNQAQALGGALTGGAQSLGDYYAMKQQRDFQNQLLSRLPQQGSAAGSPFAYSFG